MMNVRRRAKPTYPISSIVSLKPLWAFGMPLTQPGESTMLGASGPTSQKDWYPHPNSGLRAISISAKSHITVRPVKDESPYSMYDMRFILKLDTLDNMK